MSEHVSSCPQCQPVAAEWGRILWAVDQLSIEQSVRSEESCLDENELAEYIDGVAGRIVKTRIEHHLASCRNCVGRLVNLYDIVDSIEVEDCRHGFRLRWLKDGLEVIRKSLRNMEIAVLTPVPQLRGPVDSARAVACSLHHEGCDITLTTLPEEDGDTVTCVLSLAGEQPDTGLVTVSLSNEGGLLESRPLRDESTMTFLNLPAATYRLEVEFPNSAVQIEFDLERSV